MAGPGQGLGGVGDIISGGKQRKACVAQIVAAQILQITRPVKFFFFFLVLGFNLISKGASLPEDHYVVSPQRKRPFICVIQIKLDFFACTFKRLILA